MFRRLSFAAKLMVVLALTVIIAVGALSFWLNRAVGRVFQDYVTVSLRPHATVLATSLGEAYAASGDWDDARGLLTTTQEWLAAGPARRGTGRGPMANVAGESVALVVVNEGGRVVAASSDEYVGQGFAPNLIARGQPIMANGRVVGYLLTINGPREREFTERLNRSILLAGGIAGVSALVLGLLLIESLARPLRAVRDAAQRIGSGELSYRVAVDSDDEIGDLAQAFNQMAAALERNEQQRRTMMADIAHELRTPLAVIQGQVEALTDGVFPLDQEQLTPIRDQSYLLARLVDDLRDLALAEAGRLPLEYDEVDLEELVRRVAAGFQPQAMAKQITLQVEISTLPSSPRTWERDWDEEPSPSPRGRGSGRDADSVPSPRTREEGGCEGRSPSPRARGEGWGEGASISTIWADAQRIEQILANLLSNAIRHTPDGGRVAIALSAGPDVARIAVSDTGPGISLEDLPHLFDRFYRPDRSRSRAEGGTGLGLSIARRLAQAHGGDITVESAPGQGATFTVILPRGAKSASDVDQGR